MSRDETPLSAGLRDAHIVLQLSACLTADLELCLPKAVACLAV